MRIVFDLLLQPIKLRSTHLILHIFHVDEFRVEWPDGLVSRFAAVPAGASCGRASAVVEFLR